MPEILTKHPDIVIDLLKEEGIACGKGDEQKILKKDICSSQGNNVSLYFGYAFMLLIGLTLGMIIRRR